MNKMTFNLTQLLNELQAYESINDSKSGEANVAKKFKKLKVAGKLKGKFKKNGKKTKKNNSQNSGT